MRVVVVGGAVRVDLLAREPGRGAYLCGRAACLDAALRRDAQVLRRGLRATEEAVAVDGVRLRSEWQQAKPSARQKERWQEPRAEAHEE